MDFCGDGCDISRRLHVQLILLLEDSHPVHEHIAGAFDYTIQQCSDYLRILSSKLFVSLSSRNVRNFSLFKTRAPRKSIRSISKQMSPVDLSLQPYYCSLSIKCNIFWPTPLLIMPA